MFRNRKKDPQAKKVRKSRFFKNAKTKAKMLRDSPEKILPLIEKARQKANKRSGPLKEIWESLLTSFRLLKAYAKKEYREIPWESITLILASIIYLVMPIDLIADFLPGGFIDDVALIGWTMQPVKTDIENFVAWENQKDEPAS